MAGVGDGMSVAIPYIRGVGGCVGWDGSRAGRDVKGKERVTWGEISEKSIT